MATYYTNPNNQRDASAPMFYARENMSASYTETSVNPGNVMMYMNSGSFSDSLPPNSQQPPDSSEVLSATPHQEMLSVLGGSRLGEHEYNAWREGRNRVLLMESVGASVGVLDGQSLQGQGLSLSLGSQIPNGIQIPSFPYRNPNQDFGSFMTPDPPVSGEGAFSGGGRDAHSPYGISGNIPGSKYLKAAQQLLNEVVNVQNALKQSDNAERKKSEQLEKCSGEIDPSVPLNPQESLTSSAPSELSHAERQDLQNKLTKLLSLLDEVDRRYKQYYHQMHIVVSSFDAVAGFGATKPYTALALLTISRHFRCLRDAITGQIQAARKGLGEQDTLGSVKGVGISRLRFVDKQLGQQRAIQQLGMMQQHAWRPQRGLPESSVSVLRAWLFEHFLHPYPKDSDKIMLARQTGLSRSQVSNWFINARVRLWKPMVEEMYKEEAGDAEMESNSSSENASKGTRGDTWTSEDRGQDIQQSLSSTATERRNRQHLDSKPDNIPEIETAGGDGEAEYRFMAAAYQMPEMGRLGPGTGVSLTLGLQHCDGTNLPPMPVGPHYSFPPLTMRGDEIYSAAGTSAGHEAANFECINAGNQQRRFSSSQLVHDFVA